MMSHNLVRRESIVCCDCVGAEGTGRGNPQAPQGPENQAGRVLGQAVLRDRGHRDVTPVLCDTYSRARGA